ncbi:hypothetical protein B0T14DRAFT_571163 [Immersiella caudata]|uniref:Uncharacterized protein n=1 Tax=Immersiella caudata TaxID=314043 RepID=A0AA39U544_9PEZI|nr:hypothetical protein B0T14DRAFT_571163 [Immersiella caudata]
MASRRGEGVLRLRKARGFGGKARSLGLTVLMAVQHYISIPDVDRDQCDWDAPRCAPMIENGRLGLEPGLLKLPADHVVVYSVARALTVYETPSRMATLQMKCIPERLKQTTGLSKWALPMIPEPGDSERTPPVLTLDAHFRGLTVLHEPIPAGHAADGIVISGLASHPFGSWQPHGPDKSFIWIREAAPGDFRTVIDGYDSELPGSKSFQFIGDIATKMILHLKSGGWNRPESKSTVFLAHRLGWPVRMVAIVQMANPHDKGISSILDNIRGTIMFGVPTLGMDQARLMWIVEGQPNGSLIQDLSRDGPQRHVQLAVEAREKQMRLINVQTLALEEFYGEAPPHAILSHRWETEEATFKDFAAQADPSKQKKTNSGVAWSTLAASKNAHPTTKPYKRGYVCRRKGRLLKRSKTRQTVNSNERK